LLEENATKEETEQGLDLADYLIKHPTPSKKMISQISHPPPSINRCPTFMG
jgi:hypothetical protein